jgi:cobalt-precorrin-5B (C1)-methyltransferase
LVFVPGNVGRRAALARLAVDAEQVVEASNEWGYMLDALADRPVDALAVMGHPGKLAKLPGGHWNTHSSVSPSAAPYIRSLVKRYGGDPVPEVETAGGLLDAQSIAVRDRVCNVAAAAIRQAVRERTGDRFPVSVMLVDYNAEILGTAGKETPWIRP